MSLHHFGVPKVLVSRRQVVPSQVLHERTIWFWRGWQEDPEAGVSQKMSPPSPLLVCVNQPSHPPATLVARSLHHAGVDLRCASRRPITPSHELHVRATPPPLPPPPPPPPRATHMLPELGRVQKKYVPSPVPLCTYHAAHPPVTLVGMSAHHSYALAWLL